MPVGANCGEGNLRKSPSLARRERPHEAVFFVWSADGWSCFRHLAKATRTTQVATAGVVSACVHQAIELVARILTNSRCETLLLTSGLGLGQDIHPFRCAHVFPDVVPGM